MNPKMKEVAKVYGIEINDVERGKGGLFYVASDGEKRILNDIFDANDDYTAPRRESISLKKCRTYTAYSGIAFLMSDAA